MKYVLLGPTGLRVSQWCLGTMTWGEQNTEADARAQLDLAVDRGVNFIDTGEMYPIPPRPETIGKSEEFLGRWLARSGGRDHLIIASKVVGQGKTASLLRPNARLDRRNIETALNASLKRLRTDYIDVYQLHWPDRRVNNFGVLDYLHRPEEDGVPLLETLQVLDALVRAGKVRHIGVSNETPWGVMTMLQLAATHGLPRIVCIQNAYHLTNRVFDIALSEVSLRENVGLMAYAPLAFGVLTGKYLLGAKPPHARLTLYPQYTRYTGERNAAAAAKYAALAHQYGLDPAQMATAFVASRPFVVSVVGGATTLDQLRMNLDAMDLTLPTEVLRAIDALHAESPNPCP